MDTQSTPSFSRIATKPFRSPPQIISQISKPISLTTNMYPLQMTPNQEVKCFHYDVQFFPNIAEDNRDLRFRIFKAGKVQLEQSIGKLCFSGSSLYTLKKIPDNSIKQIQAVCNIRVDDTAYTLKLRLVDEFHFREEDALNEGSAIAIKSNKVTQLLNIIFKDIIRQNMSFKEIGRNSKFYNTNQGQINFVKTRDGQLEVYTGMKFNIQPTVRGLHLLVDYASRILRTETAEQFLARWNGDKETARQQMIGQSVITEYNNYQIYKIDDVDLKKNPLSTFLDTKTNQQITYAQYYKNRYNITVKNLKQPLLLHKRKMYEANTNRKILKDIFLIPELCKMTGMTEQQHEDFQAMRDISQFTKLNPNQRQQKSSEIIQILSSYSDKNGVQIPKQDPQVSAILLNPPQIYFGKNKSICPDKGNFDIRQAIKDTNCRFEEWILIYQKRDQNAADNLYDFMKKASGIYGIQVNEPIWFEVQSSLGKDWISQLDQDFTKNGLPKFVVSIAQNKELYRQLKDFLYNEVGLEHQNLKPNSLQKNGMSVVSKIILQIAAKLGFNLWETERPKELSKKAMLIGIETSMKSVKCKGKSYNSIGIVASLNESFSKYYNEAELREPNDVQLNNLSEVLVRAFKAYLKNNSFLPEEIIIYRQGQGEGQIQKSLDLEIKAIQRSFEMMNANYKPKFAYFQVNKKISEKFYRNSQNKYDNPISGTLVADNVVSRHFEFFLCAQNCNSGVCTPTKYLCLFNNLTLKEETFWQLTYYQCYNYYNWQGPVRIPGCMMYASKLAKFTAEVLLQCAREELNNSKYYL